MSILELEHRNNMKKLFAVMCSPGQLRRNYFYIAFIKKIKIKLSNDYFVDNVQ